MPSLSTLSTTITIRTRRVWLLVIAHMLLCLPLPRRQREAIARWFWARVRYEYRFGRGPWHRIAQPELQFP